MATLLRSLDDWFATPLGAYLWAGEETLFAGYLADCFGQHGLEVGSPAAGDDCLRMASVPHCVRLYCGDNAGVVDGAFRGRLDSLSLQPRSLSAVLLVHVLEFHPAPGRVLAALEQALMPGGLLLMAAFNPWSLWGLRRRLRPGLQPWCGRRVSAHRCRDWLKALNLQIGGSAYLAHRPPFEDARWLARFAWMDYLGHWFPAGGAYVIAARKREFAGQRVRHLERDCPAVLAPSAPRATPRIARDHAA